MRFLCRFRIPVLTVLLLAAAIFFMRRPAAAGQLFRYDFDSGTTNASSVVSGVTASPVAAQNLSTAVNLNVYQTSNYGSTFDAAQYFDLTATAASGKALNLTDLRFTPETPSQANALTAYVRSSVDSFVSNIYSRNIPSNSFFFNETIDLTGAAYQNLSGITFRFYGISPSTSSVLYYDGINLNGAVANAVPEPSTWGLALAGLACAGWSLRRKSVRSCRSGPGVNTLGHFPTARRSGHSS